MAPLRMLVLAALAVSTLAFTDKAEGNKHALAKAEKKADLLQSLERTEPAAPAEAGAPAKPFFYPFYPMAPLDKDALAKYQAQWTEAVKTFYTSPFAWYYTFPWWSMWWMWPYMGYYMWLSPWMWMFWY